MNVNNLLIPYIYFQKEKPPKPENAFFRKKMTLSPKSYFDHLNLSSWQNQYLNSPFIHTWIITRICIYFCGF